MVRSAIEIVQAAYDAVLSGDLDGFTADFADDCQLIEVDSLPYRGVHRGPEGIKRAVQEIFSYFTVFEFKVERIVHSDDCVIAYGPLHAVSKKNGQSIDQLLAEIWHVEGGKIKKIIPLYAESGEVAEAIS